jgi:uncharacterized membrane protein YgdD (TMEM256/DUF423 family)
VPVWLFLGALNGLLAVAAGAYGRHGPFDDYGREMVAIAAQYQMAHALALIAVAWLASRSDLRHWLTAVAGVAFAIGSVLFSGTLYWLAFAQALPAAGIAPVGGGLLMLGWLALIVQAVALAQRRGAMRGEDPSQR